MINGNNSIRTSYRSSYSYSNYVKCSSCNTQSINGNNLKYYNVDIICKHFNYLYDYLGKLYIYCASCLDQYLIKNDTNVKFICHCKNSIQN